MQKHPTGETSEMLLITTSSGITRKLRREINYETILQPVLWSDTVSCAAKFYDANDVLRSTILLIILRSFIKRRLRVFTKYLKESCNDL